MAFALLFLLAGGSGYADRVYRRDGSVVEGRIVRETGVEVTLEVRGFEVRIPREQIDRIERTSVATAADPFLAEARQALDAGDPAAAWSSLIRARAADPGAMASERLLVDRVVEAMLAGAKAYLDAGRPADAASFYAELLQEDAAALLAGATGTGREAVERLALTAEGRALFEQGREAFQRDPALLEVSEKLRKAAALMERSDPGWSDAALLLAQNLVRRGRSLAASGDRLGAQQLYNEGLEYLHAIGTTGARPSVATLAQARSMISQLRREGIDLTASLLVTPTPLPMPGTRPEANATPVAAPVATAVPAPVAAPTPVPGYLHRLGGYLSPPTAPVREDAAPEEQWGTRIGAALAYAIRLLVLAVPAYLLWWLPALGALRFMERGGNIFAARRKGQAKALGPVALVLAVLDTRAATSTRGRKEKAKKPCPHCQGELSNPELYQTPAFDLCPHCGRQVTPAFDLDEYLKYMAEVLRLDAERADRGAIPMNEFLKNSRMERMIGALLTDSVRRRASDVHIEPSETGLKIRRRVDGMMTDLVTLPKAMGNPLVSALKVRAELDVSERRRPQDGSMSLGIDGHVIDMRVACSPAANGEKMSIRLLDIRTIQVNPKKLGMTESQRDIFEKAIALPHGLLLVCGPTGSGKTTTLYVALQKIREQEKNIISIEDPIEFRLPGINQHQVNPAAGFTFASGLRSILRQDPDVIMIGEIRDKDTAEISIEAATTGHLVLSTTHTIDSASAMARLMEFGITPRRIADSVALIIAQRLIRLVCPDCRKMRKPTGDEIADLDLAQYDLDRMEVAVASGCPTCNRTGYFGRTGLFEMLLATDRVRQALQASDVATEEIRQIAIRAGMMTMRQQGMELLRRGLTTAEELSRVTR